MKHNIVLLSLLILTTSVVFMNCAHDHAHDHPEDIVDHHEGEDDEVALNMEQISNIGIEYQQIEARKIQSIVKIPGRVELPPLGRSVVGSQLDGKIIGVYTKPGQYVQKGQRLFALENLEIIDWQQNLQKENAERDYLTKELKRQKTLSEDQIAPIKNYEATEAKLKQSEALIRGLKSKLEAIGVDFTEGNSFQKNIIVQAPAAGVVQHISADLGTFINTGDQLAEIIDNRNLHLHLSAYGTDISKLEKDQMINFFIQSNPEEILEAKIFWINTMVDENSNSYDVHAEIIKTDQTLTAGEFVEARVINQERLINTLPRESVTGDKGLKYIFIKEEEHEDETHFLKIQVMTGEQDLGFVEVTPIDPIPVNAEVVTKGAFFLMAESKKNEGAGGGHSH